MTVMEWDRTGPGTVEWDGPGTVEWDGPGTVEWDGPGTVEWDGPGTVEWAGPQQRAGPGMGWDGVRWFVQCTLNRNLIGLG
jgi:hypothetical protein